MKGCGLTRVGGVCFEGGVDFVPLGREIEAAGVSCVQKSVKETAALVSDTDTEQQKWMESLIRGLS